MLPYPMDELVSIVAERRRAKRNLQIASSAGRQIAERASGVLPLLKKRREREWTGRTLLRPSEVDSAVLLRADAGGETDPANLLRSVGGEPIG
jgi:hypothetical protein